MLFLLSVTLLVIARPASAHPAPYSYLDLTLEEQRISGSLTVHTIDLAHELEIDEPTILLDAGVLSKQHSAINTFVRPRLRLTDADGSNLALRFGEVEPLPGEDAVQLKFTVSGPPPAALVLDAALFPYDPAHQTFVNVYEGETLAQQWLFDATSPPRTFFAGSAAGVAAVFETFVPSGARHVLIGPDHVLFLIGLILLGGSLRRLALIVTAFTVGHSITLALATLNILAPPAWLIEPLVALSIVVVGLDNLMQGKSGKEGHDYRAWFAVLFGLIHGFGFAYVLREFGLPQANLAWSLFAFNIGVEIGQLAIVIPVALLLAAIRKRALLASQRIAMFGSLAVIVVGAYWFVDRVRMMAG